MDKQKGHILIVDDDKDVLHTARIVLKPVFSSIETESNPQQLNYLLSHKTYNVILLDMNYTAGATSGKEGLYWLKHILTKKPDQQVVLMTAYGDLKLAVEAMKVGASDFIVKPWENEKLQATVLAAYNHSNSKEEINQLKERQSKMHKIINDADEQIIGASPEMQSVYTTIDKVAETTANVLILGENGTGKELVAKAIHNQSDRNGEVFIKVDLGAISENLFESELFGHKKGAFTDAREDRTGRFVLADKGTLFLDEIGNLSSSMQAKLLTAIQTKTITPVGADVPVKVDCRIIAATNENLQQMIDDKKFREDLLYRLNTVEITLPPLKDRQGDMELLVEHFLRIFNKKYRKSLGLSKEALQTLLAHNWPGNIRELQHTIERAVIMADGGTLEKQDFLFKSPNQQKTADTLNLDELEKSAIEEAIRKNKGNMSQAAQELGLGRTTLYRKLEKYNIR